MNNNIHLSEREALESLRGSITSEIEVAEELLDSWALLGPTIEWLEELKNKIKEHEEILMSEDGGEPLEPEELEELLIWAESFSDTLNEGADIEENCIHPNTSKEIISALEKLISLVTQPIQKAGWNLYNSSIRAD